MHIQIAYQFITTPTSFNLYIIRTVNNLVLINTLTNEKKDWMKKYYKIIRGIETMADIQLQLQNIVKLAEVANIQLAKIKITILQASDIYKIQIVGDIFSILEDLQNIIQGDIETQAYHTQTLLADELDRYKEKKCIC